MNPHQFIVIRARTLPGGLYKEPSGRAAGPQRTQAQGWHCLRRAAVRGAQEEGYIGTRLLSALGAKGKGPGPINLGRKTEAGLRGSMAGGVSLLKIRPRVLDLSTYLASDPGPSPHWP